MAVEGTVLCKELELYECIQCGKCTGGCPVAIRSSLNPRRLIYEALLGERFNPVEKDRNMGVYNLRHLCRALSQGSSAL